MRVHVITFCFVVSVAGSSAVAVSAESMSSAEQEVWSGEQRYWDLRAAGKIDEYMNLWLDEFTGWPWSTAQPVGKAGIRAEVTNSLAKIRPGSLTTTLEPLSVRIHGDFAFVYYRVHAMRVDMTGNQIQTIVRIHHTWLHTRAGWKIIAGMSARDDTPK